MKSDLSLGDLKNQKKQKSFIKRALKQISNFLKLKLHMRPELAFFISFSLLGTRNWFIFWQEI